MVKITSFKWAEKDDPMFTGGFHIHSVKKQESGQNKKKKDKINNEKKSNQRKKSSNKLS